MSAEIEVLDVRAVWFWNESFLHLYVGERWIVSVGMSQSSGWAWHRRGYDGHYHEWCFGRFGEVLRMEDHMIEKAGVK